MKTITITTRNGKPSTEGRISQFGDGTFWASIVSRSSDGHDDIAFESYSYKTLKGAEKFINDYRNKKREAYERGELVEGVVVL
jgi:hypothetical protein